MERIYLRGKGTFISQDEATGRARLTISRTHKVLLRHTYQKVEETLAGSHPDFLGYLGEVLAQEAARESGLEQVVFEGVLLGGVIFDCEALRCLEEYLEVHEIRLALDDKKRALLGFYSGRIASMSIRVEGFNPDYFEFRSTKRHPEVWEELRPVALTYMAARLLEGELGRERDMLGTYQYTSALSAVTTLHKRAEREVQWILGKAFNAERTAARWALLCYLPIMEALQARGSSA